MNIAAKITPTSATLDQLKHGSEFPGGNINARLTYTQDEIEELAASLKGPDGQLRPLLVATHSKKPGAFFVFGGGRRRMAFELLIGRGELPKDHRIEIACHGEITPAQALSRSFADNQAIPMHPADQAATFAQLAKDRAAEDIAKERGMTVRAVNQSIALGTTLAPEVLAGWRAGKLTREEVEVFTVAPDFESQAKALAGSWGYQNGRGIKINEVRRDLTKNKEPEMKRLLGFVGVADARAAGIEIVEDFFGSGGLVKDVKALRQLAQVKMAGIAADLEKQGWSWVETLMAPNFMHHGYGAVRATPVFTPEEKKRAAYLKAQIQVLEESDSDDSYSQQIALEKEKLKIENAAAFRGFDAKQKAKSGVIVMLTAEGAVDYRGGLIRKAEPKGKAKKNAPAAQRAPEAPKIPDITREVEKALEDAQGDALAELIAAKPKEAFAMFLSAIPHCDWNDAVMWNEVNEHANGVIPGKSFADAFGQLRKLPIEKLAAKLAVLVGKVANVSGYITGDKDAAAIVDLVGEKALQAGLAKRFDPKSYVAGASKQHLLGILAETQGEAVRKAHEQDGEAKLALPVILAIKATSWLPPLLRTRSYAGPSAKNVGKPAKKKA
jgi:ParB family chromosome partitioning protein